MNIHQSLDRDDEIKKINFFSSVLGRISEAIEKIFFRVWNA
jgi:hypothetical protein